MPVGTEQFVQITFNDEIPVPMEGVRSAARLSGSVSGPFQIRTNENTVTISNSKGTIQDLALPEGLRVETDVVVGLIDAARKNQQLGIIPENVNGYLRLSDIDSLGGSSRIAVRGLAAPQVGFVSQTAARGHQVVPGWRMAAREEVTNTVDLTTFVRQTVRFPQFVEPVSGDPVIKVTYPTTQKRCLRCRTAGFENDMRFSPQGEVVLIQNEDVLNQSLLKLIITEKGSNVFHTYYGTELHDRIGIKQGAAATTTIREDIQRAIDVFQRLQTASGQYQEISARERLFRVLSLTVTPSTSDPTVTFVEIVATNAAGRQVVVSTVFAAPGSAALVGSNGLSLGLAPLPNLDEGL